MENLISPPKKIGLSDKDKNVMKVMQKKATPPQKMTSPEKEKAKENLRRIIQQVGVNPQDILRGEQYAKQSLKNPKMYPIAVQMAIKEGLLPPDTPVTAKIDFKVITTALTAGKLVRELMEEGKI
jgi:hypothetical protein